MNMNLKKYNNYINENKKIDDLNNMIIFYYGDIKSGIEDKFKKLPKKNIDDAIALTSLRPDLSIRYYSNYFYNDYNKKF